jgi:signal transduction histidine kinase
VRLAHAHGAYRLEIHDDGVGFDMASRPGEGHHGLANMAARMRAAGGALVVETEAGSGTRIIVTVPHPAERNSTEDA